ncbi:MAG: exo-alpha-sialidase [Elainellaceae cyanobacterium]
MTNIQTGTTPPSIQSNAADITGRLVSTPAILAGTSEGLWWIEPEPHLELKGHSIDALAIGQGKVWAIVDRHSVWQRDPNGEWHSLISGNHQRLNCLLQIDQTIWVGASNTHLMQITNGSLNSIRSFDEVEGREEWYTPWGDPPDVRSMAVGTSGELYANIHVGGILRSLDAGLSWQPTIDFHADVHQVCTVSNRPGLVLAATAQGLAISSDAGDTWQFDRANLHAPYSRAVAVCEDTILMTSSTGPQGNQATVYRRAIDQPGTFQKCDRGLPEWFRGNINTNCLSTYKQQAAFGTKDGQIFISKDAALTWQQLATDLSLVQCLSFA